MVLLYKNTRKNKLTCFFHINIFHVNLAYSNLTAQWMSDLYSHKPNTKLKNIIIPATHNTATSQINILSKIAPGDPYYYNFVRPIVYSWSKCQFLDVYQQLIKGIRKFDFRVAFLKNEPVLVHGLVSTTLKDVLLDIKKFIRKHPREIILIEYSIYWPSGNGKRLSKTREQEKKT